MFPRLMPPSLRSSIGYRMMTSRMLVLCVCIGALGAGEAGTQPPRHPPKKPKATDAAPSAPTAAPSAPSAPSANGAGDSPDLIFLTNHQRLAGVVEQSPGGKDDLVTVRLHDGGVIRIRRDLIQQEELGFESRRAAVRDGDFAGAVELARWCEGKGRREDALAMIELALGWSGSAPSRQALLDAQALHARLVDMVRSAKEALPLYQAYRDGGGNDADTIARLDQLEEAVRQHQASLPKASAEVDGTASAVAVAGGREMLESKHWDPESATYSNPIDVSDLALETRDGTNHVLDVLVHGSPGGKEKHDKAALRRTTPGGIAGASAFQFYVRNLGEHPMRLTIGLKTGDWVFHESAMQTVAVSTEQEPWALMTFDLKANTFKSAATQWANNGAVANLEDVKEVQILLYNGQGEGHLQFDQVQFTTPEMH